MLTAGPSVWWALLQFDMFVQQSFHRILGQIDDELVLTDQDPR